MSPPAQLPGLEALGIEPAALEAIAASYLAPGTGVARLNRWRAGAAAVEPPVVHRACSIRRRITAMRHSHRACRRTAS